jgi:DNA-binding SARP family transcriptional activator
MNDLRFSLLGPVRAWVGADEVDLGSPQQRALLAVLLLRRSGPVSSEYAVRALWGGSAPKAAEGTVRTYICRLRRILSDKVGADRFVIRSQGGGYMVKADDATVDTELFPKYLSRARRTLAEGTARDALELFRDSLSLWRGVPVTGVNTTFFATERARLEQLWATAVEEMAAIGIELGENAEAVLTLRAAVGAQPLREKLWELLVRGLSRLGRRADALAAYQDARRVLQDELGLEPGPELRELHRRILAAEPLPPLGEPDPDRVPASVPRQLPAEQYGFVGRAPELDSVVSVLSKSRAATVVGITGAAGLGKTMLAFRAAHAVRPHFPDGQLHAVLGDSQDIRAVLTEFLRALGVPAAWIPSSLPELTSLWRTTVDGKRVLIVLDDVRDSGQILPLLPTSAGAAVIVTGSRSVDVPNLHLVTLDGLTLADALQLLGSLVGHDRLRDEPEASARLAATCSYRPGDIRIAAAKLLARPRRAVREVELEIRTRVVADTRHLGGAHCLA